MTKIRRSWIALLLGGLLLATLVGVVWAKPKGEPAAHGTAAKLDKPKSHHGAFHYTVTIPGGHFHPRYDGLDWYNGGNYIQMTSGVGQFTAAVPMLPGNRTVESVTMYVQDNNGAVDACVYLRRTKTDGTETSMASVCSTGSSGSIRTFSDTSISPSTIWGGHGAYLYLSIASTNIQVYSVQINYY
jgi:hypothetical protein